MSSRKSRMTTLQTLYTEHVRLHGKFPKPQNRFSHDHTTTPMVHVTKVDEVNRKNSAMRIPTTSTTSGNHSTTTTNSTTPPRRSLGGRFRELLERVSRQFRGSRRVEEGPGRVRIEQVHFVRVGQEIKTSKLHNSLLIPLAELSLRW